MEPISMLAIGVAALSSLAFLGGRRRRSRNKRALLTAGAVDSRTEDMTDVRAEDGVTIDVDDATWLAIRDALGWPGRWGGGEPSTPWEKGKLGVDCGGSIQMFLVRLGLLSSRARDRGAIALANDCDPVPVGQQRPGDLSIYRGRHVMLVVSEPRADIGGHSHVFGASGVSADLQGYDPSAPGYTTEARVKLFRTARYRRDFLTYGRLRA